MARRKSTTEAGNPSFEEALSELQEIVDRLDEGELPLNDALQGFERGIHLYRLCGELLENAESKVEILQSSLQSGSPQTIPFDPVATHQSPPTERKISEPTIDPGLISSPVISLPTVSIPEESILMSSSPLSDSTPEPTTNVHLHEPSVGSTPAEGPRTGGSRPAKVLFDTEELSIDRDADRE
jgi:exodeoxyribonuclease VII small subunit